MREAESHHRVAPSQGGFLSGFYHLAMRLRLRCTSHISRRGSLPFTSSFLSPASPLISIFTHERRKVEKCPQSYSAAMRSVPFAVYCPIHPPIRHLSFFFFLPPTPSLSLSLPPSPFVFTTWLFSFKWKGPSAEKCIFSLTLMRMRELRL